LPAWRRLTLWLAGLALGASGCPAAGPGAVTAGGPDPHTILQAQGPASLYEVRRSVELQGLEARVYALLAAAATGAGRSVPTTDEAACKAARQIARGLLPSGPPPSPLVEFAMRSEGLVDPPPHLIVASALEGRERELLDQLATRLERILRQGSYLRAGIGVQTPQRIPDERRLVIALLESRVRFRALPRELRLGQRASLSFDVLSSHSPVRLIWAEPSGRIVSGPPAAPRHYSRELTCSERGVYQIEVTGDGQFGAEVLANFPVYCDQAAPRDVQYGAAPVVLGSESSLEREVFELTNKVRQAAGLPLFRNNDAVALVARSHSQDMRDAGFVGHVSPRTGSPADRLRRAKIVHLVARENVARAYSPAEALSELQKSPAHKANLMATDVDELGVGVMVDRSGASPVLLVTQNFIRSGTAYDASAGPGPAYRVVDQRRKTGGLPPLQRELELEKLAARYLQRALGLGGGAADPKAADAELSASLRTLGNRFQQVEGVLVKVSVVEGLAQASDLGKRGPTHIGIGVASHDGQAAIFLLLATPR
jgi:uncharacterized protein YkwD